MFDGQLRSKIETLEVVPHGPTETYAACLKALRGKEKNVQASTLNQAPLGLIEMAMFLDVIGPQNA